MHAVILGWAQTPIFGSAVGVGTYSGIAACSEVSATTVDTFGYVYVTGTFSGTVGSGSFTLSTGSATNQDVFVAKLDGSGNYIWVAQGGGISQNMGGGIAVDANGAIYVTGTFYSPTASFGPHVLTATYSGYSTVSNSDIFVGRLDANGNWLWATAAGAPVATERVRWWSTQLEMCISPAVFRARRPPLAPLPQLTPPIMPTCMNCWLPKSTPKACGRGPVVGVGVGRTWALPLRWTGTTMYYQWISAGAMGQAGPFSLPANTYSADDVLVAKLDANGTWLWAVRAGSLSIDEGHGTAVDASGNAYITGYFSEASAIFGPSTLPNGGPRYGYGGTREIFVAKLNPAGVWQWAAQAGGDSNDFGKAIALGSPSQLLVAGDLTSTAMQFGAAGSLANTSRGAPPAGKCSIRPTPIWPLSARAALGSVQRVAKDSTMNTLIHWWWTRRVTPV